jgi:hypothetical protein
MYPAPAYRMIAIAPCHPAGETGRAANYSRRRGARNPGPSPEAADRPVSPVSYAGNSAGRPVPGAIPTPQVPPVREGFGNIYTDPGTIYVSSCGDDEPDRDPVSMPVAGISRQCRPAGWERLYNHKVNLDTLCDGEPTTSDYLRKLVLTLVPAMRKFV